MQHFFVGARCAFAGFFHHRHAELFKEYFADLFRTVEIKRLTGQFMRGLLQLQQCLSQMMRLCVQFIHVEQYAVALHAVQHFGSRQFDGFVHGFQSCIRHDLRVHDGVQRDAQRGILDRVGCGFFDVHLCKRNLVSAFAAQVFIRQAGDVHVARGDRVQTMLRGRIKHVGFEQRIVYHAL